MKSLRVSAGLGLILLSLIASILYFISMIDPAGTQMANDENPFGTPPSRASSFVALCVSVAVGFGGGYLLIPRSKVR